VFCQLRFPCGGWEVKQLGWDSELGRDRSVPSVSIPGANHLPPGIRYVSGGALRSLRGSIRRHSAKHGGEPGGLSPLPGSPPLCLSYAFGQLAIGESLELQNHIDIVLVTGIGGDEMVHPARVVLLAGGSPVHNLPRQRAARTALGVEVDVLSFRVAKEPATPAQLAVDADVASVHKVWGETL